MAELQRADSSEKNNDFFNSIWDIAAVEPRCQHADTVTGTTEEERQRDEKWLEIQGRCHQ